MALLGKKISLDEIPEEESSFDPIPAGTYSAKITKTELKQTRSGDGQYISVQYAILGPSHQGRIIFDNLNIDNPNGQAVKIAYQRLAQIMKAANLETVEDTDEFVGAVVNIVLGMKNDAKYGASNNVKAIKKYDGVSETSSLPVEAATETSPKKKSASAPPWAS